MSTKVSTHSIPMIVHQILGKKGNDIVDKCLASWQKLVPLGFTILTWNDLQLAEFIFDNYRFSYEAFVNSRNHGEASDIARYLLVYHFGGFYTDWDIELLDVPKFLDLADKYPNGYMLCDPRNNSINSEYFCAKERDPYLFNLSKDIAELYGTEEWKNLYTPQYSGPYRMRDSLAKHPRTSIISVPTKEVFAYDYSEIRNPPEGKVDKPLIHYWVHSWVY